MDEAETATLDVPQLEEKPAPSPAPPTPAKPTAAPAPVKPARTVQSLILLFGTKGAGKSIMLQALVRHGLLHGHRFLIGDHMGQWHRPDWPRDKVLIRRTRNLEMLCREACRLAPITIVFDEIDLEVNSQRPIDPKSCLYEVLHMGRNPRPPGPDTLFPHRGPVGIIGAARRPGNLRVDLKDLVDRVYLGRTNGERAIRWIADAIDDPREAESLRHRERNVWTYRDLT